MHAHCGVLREHVLRAADACFGHRLMMDRIVPGGVAADLTAGGIASIRTLIRTIRRRFPELVELYDNTASLQDRTVTTGILDGRAGALRRRRLCRPRLRPRLRCARTPGYAPYTALAFDVPVREEGDVDARVWVRINEVAQSLALIEQILDRLPPGQIGAIRRGGRGKAWRWSRASAATSWPGCASAPTAPSRAAICAIRPGSSGRCWRRPSRATSSPTSRSATNPSTAPTRGTTSRGRRCASCCSRACCSRR